MTNCVCGGDPPGNPNSECERCQMIVEIHRLDYALVESEERVEELVAAKRRGQSEYEVFCAGWRAGRDAAEGIKTPSMLEQDGTLESDWKEYRLARHTSEEVR